MKRILSSTIQVFKQIKSDPMMFAACFTPFVMGALIKFGIPFIERITDFSLQTYYPIFDLLLSIMAPVLLCFAFAMITLEEIDDKVSRYFSITPLGKSGYLFTRLGVPSIISAVIAFIVLLLFSLEKLSIGMTICLALLGSVQAIIVSLMIITLSSNKLEGMAVTKLAALTLLGIPAPFFIDSYYQFSVGFLPSFWVAKAMQNEAVLYFSIGLMVALVWYYFLTKRLFRKLAG
ncbi:ABC transporter permease [Clostridioides difficile]|uniref:ABC transporter permease n=1 Tax=Clostridioides difficile TaxID=1496 RepID=UPI00142FC360|nr:ABC transporter permease [Clostridioides difficile]MCP8337550.1 ABC transporter permease [Clostridioides difficile]MCP8382135.1 ABC transporter permease [Clostridioides difficile]NJA28574.1 ABC transporter permease [Clostridioides difficile]NKN19906.1 ABC transporter permease [Clostridioides difficile]